MEAILEVKKFIELMAEKKLSVSDSIDLCNAFYGIAVGIPHEDDETKSIHDLLISHAIHHAETALNALRSEEAKEKLGDIGESVDEIAFHIETKLTELKQLRG